MSVGRSRCFYKRLVVIALLCRRPVAIQSILGYLTPLFDMEEGVSASSILSLPINDLSEPIQATIKLKKIKTINRVYKMNKMALQMLLKAGNTPAGAKWACVLQGLHSQEHGAFVSKCDGVETSNRQTLKPCEATLRICDPWSETPHYTACTQRFINTGWIMSEADENKPRRWNTSEFASVCCFFNPPNHFILPVSVPQPCGDTRSNGKWPLAGH